MGALDWAYIVAVLFLAPDFGFAAFGLRLHGYVEKRGYLEAGRR